MCSLYNCFVAKPSLKQFNGCTVVIPFEWKSSNSWFRGFFDESTQVCELIDLRQRFIFVDCAVEGIPEFCPLVDLSGKFSYFELWQSRARMSQFWRRSRLVLLTMGIVRSGVLTIGFGGCDTTIDFIFHLGRLLNPRGFVRPIIR